MLNLRHALVATVATVALIPAGQAHASVADADAVRTLAADAAGLLAQEVDLIALSDPSTSSTTAELAEARSQLRMVDDEGASVLEQLRGFDVALTPAIEAALERLPQSAGANADAVSLTPQPMVYDAAIDDLRRIAANPAAVVPVGDGADGASSTLLLVAAVALLILVGAALTNTWWRRPDQLELEAMAWSDGLTGLANRRRLDHDLDATQSDAPTSVIMIDVDRFKEINDGFGHQTGDDVLKRLGALFGLHVRHGDVVYRYGGEEFCILLPGATPDEAGSVADRIVAAARDIDLPNGEHVTVSVGVADADAATDLATVVARADRALYLAKQQGRDRAVHAPSDLVTA